MIIHSDSNNGILYLISTEIIQTLVYEIYSPLHPTLLILNYEVKGRILKQFYTEKHFFLTNTLTAN